MSVKIIHKIFSSDTCPTHTITCYIILLLLLLFYFNNQIYLLSLRERIIAWVSSLLRYMLVTFIIQWFWVQYLSCLGFFLTTRFCLWILPYSYLNILVFMLSTLTTSSWSDARHYACQCVKSWSKKIPWY